MPRGVYARKAEAKKPEKKSAGLSKKAEKALAKDKLPALLKLTELELLKMEKLSAQIRAADSDIVITHSQKMSYLAQIDPHGTLQKFDSKLKGLQSERAEAEMEYKQTSTDVENRLGISLKEYAYDDRSGILNKVVDDEVGGKATP